MNNREVLLAVRLGKVHGVGFDLLPLVHMSEPFEEEGVTTELVECYTDGCENLTPEDSGSPFSTCCECKQMR